MKNRCTLIDRENYLLWESSYKRVFQQFTLSPPNKVQKNVIFACNRFQSIQYQLATSF